MVTLAINQRATPAEAARVTAHAKFADQCWTNKNKHNHLCSHCFRPQSVGTAQAIYALAAGVITAALAVLLQGISSNLGSARPLSSSQNPSAPQAHPAQFPNQNNRENISKSRESARSIRD